jgi:hypothetical protein
LRTHAILFLICCTVSGGLFGQAPRTRAEQIEQARQAKEAQLKPEEVSPTERRLRDIKDQKVLERITAGYNGFRAKIGNMVTGGGFAIGPEYYREDLLNGNLVARASAQVSTRAYTRFDAEATLPRLANDKLALNFLASRRDYNSLQFYGPGPDSERTGRSNYRLEDFLVEGTGVVKVLPWANVGGSLGGLWVSNSCARAYSGRLTIATIRLGRSRAATTSFNTRGIRTGTGRYSDFAAWTWICSSTSRS